MIKEQHYTRTFDDELKPSSTGTVTPSASLFVALYLVILAFFILLNSISVIRSDVTKKVLEGVRDTFSDASTDYKTKIHYTYNSAGLEIAFENYSAFLLGNVARESITMQKATVVHFGSHSEITIPTNIFFLTRSSTIRTEQQGFLISLAEELTKLQDLARVDIEFSVGRKTVAESPSSPVSTSIARAGSFASALQRLGVNTASILVGLDPELPANEVTIRFYVRSLEENRTTRPIVPTDVKTESQEASDE